MPFVLIVAVRFFKKKGKTTVYIIHARDQESRAAPVLVKDVPFVVESVDSFMCLRKITYDRKHQKQGEIPFCCSSETVK